jgi:hypothetical protein
MVIEECVIDGVTWVRKPGTTTTTAVFRAALEQIARWNPNWDLIHWNPWDFEELEEHHGFDKATWAALQIRDGWRKKGERRRRIDVEAEMARDKARHEREWAAKEARWAKAAKRYDQERHEARLALLEDQMSLRRLEEELSGFRGGNRFPRHPRRDEEIAKLDQERARWQSSVAELSAKVGDPEAVLDEGGRLPAERRAMNLLTFRFDREREVKQLRAEIDQVDVQLKAAGKPRDSKLTATRSVLQMRMDVLLRIPPLEGDDMCADCSRPLMLHGWRLSPDGQDYCIAWPRNRAHRKQAYEMFQQMVRQHEQREKREKERAVEAAKAMVPAPQPLATFGANVAASTVMKRLAAIQENHPGAKLKSHSDGFEVWPSAKERAAIERAAFRAQIEK